MGRGRKQQLPELTLDMSTELPETDGNSPECCGSKSEHGAAMFCHRTQSSENQELYSVIGDVNRDKPQGIEESGTEIYGYVEEIGGGVINNKLIIEDGGSRLGKKRGRKPKKNKERLHVQDAECAPVGQSGEKVEKVEGESPANGQTMKRMVQLAASG
ncbi:hypothetical protein GH714_004718 [Hevea brasiliensis]|uniref:Uncharacterized protein n=1 Tax=Hevea brasiliensis TaxID=3981 RepID=A0A6A6N0B0_HEVBR|nr:hypothetical protein GH714_004718 [Hevea brasiliensis]